jgi:hypothetical protein
MNVTHDACERFPGRRMRWWQSYGGPPAIRRMTASPISGLEFTYVSFNCRAQLLLRDDAYLSAYNFEFITLHNY